MREGSGGLGAWMMMGLAVLVAACGNPGSTEPAVAATSTISPLLLPMAQTLAASSAYLRGCRSAYAANLTGQLSYRGIRPGTTKTTDFPALIGSPKEIRGDTRQEYLFEGFAVAVEDGVVDSAMVGSAPQPYGSLASVLATLGCPDLVLARSTAEDGIPLGYDRTQFVYLDLGVAFTFDQHPVTVEALPFFTEYFVPSTLRGFLEWAHLDKDLAVRQRPVDWEAAVR